jgi:GH43 family beta-xylosidase
MDPRLWAAQLETIMRDLLPRTAALFCAIVFASTGSSALGQEKSAAVALGDTGIPGADPSVILTDDGYVAVESRRGHALLVRVAPSLEALSEVRAVRIWFDRDRLGEVWAPEIVFRDGKYSVYFAAGVGSDHRMYQISSSKPDADYGAASEIHLPGDKWAIDGLPFTYGNSDYFAWSGWQGDTDVQQDIFIVRLGEDGEPQGSSDRIASPDQPWENVAGETPTINEGPQPIVDPGGQLHIVYSANGSWGPNYCLADLRLKSGGDPMDADAWDKSDGCLFGANQGTLADGATLTTRAKGVGHHSFVLADGDAEKGPTAPASAPFLYHGVPADMETSDFWAARKWFIGSYQWIPDVPYGSGDDTATGWSPRFVE